MRLNNRIRTGVTAILMLFLLAGATSVQASEPPAGGSYLDMGQTVVQMSGTNECGIRNLAVSYQLEYSNPSNAAYLTANKPKVQSIVFGALSDYFATHDSYTFDAVRALLDAEIREAFGADIVASVVVTQLSQFGQ
ncbi:MAG TPA: hypothetical protein DCL95_15985 [Rhodospirillaceae bacterium]|nr:hypothetical protein [Rhodospirillaceae bacterium]MBB56831.1 hypothetical protein [Rhodospirillaceae bacterium]HAJ21533.1 hypothetical protein [Rhodospirillaceae bacterium]HBM12279.1 hypothetical protein [Rhodospirillaceae bacterium]